MKTGNVTESFNAFVKCNLSHDKEIFKNNKKIAILETMFIKYFSLLKCKSLSDIINKIDKNNKNELLITNIKLIYKKNENILNEIN